MKTFVCPDTLHAHAAALPVKQSRGHQRKANRGWFLRYLVSLALLLGISHDAMALEFVCKTQDQQRLLRIEIPGKEHLCEVSVTRSDKGKREVKWYARNDTLFCSARAYELRDKYEELWGFTCTTSPDLDGIDQLSSTQRLILDERLKFYIAAGKKADPTFEVLSVRAVASTPLDKQEAKIALQFFTDSGDFTEIIHDQVQSWNIMSTIEQLSSFIISDVPVQSALMHSISDDSEIEVHTHLSDVADTVCSGKQILTLARDSGTLEPLSSHRFMCQDKTQTAQNAD